MVTEANPLLPASYDIAFALFVIAHIVLILVAFVSLVRRAKTLTPWQAIAWILIVLLVPILGALAWLLIGRRAYAAGPLSGSGRIR